MDVFQFGFIFIICISITLNATFLKNMVRKRNKTSYQFLCLHLSVADILQCSLGYVPEAICLSTSRSTLFSLKPFCHYAAFVILAISCASISLALLINLFRLLTLVAPFKMYNIEGSKHEISRFVGLSYLVGLISATPPLFDVSRYTTESSGRRCSIDFNATSFESQLYLTYLIVTFFFFPLAIGFTIMIISTIDTSEKITNSKSCYGKQHDITMQLVKDRQSLFFHSSLNLALFMVVWAPYASCSLITLLYGYTLPDWLLNISALFAKLSTLTNAFVYCYREKYKLVKRIVTR